MMESFFASGRAADVVLAVMAAEGLWMVWRGRSPRAVAAALLPGAFIVLGIRGALTGAGWMFVAAPLMLAFVAHLADLAVRPLPLKDPAARR